MKTLAQNGKVVFGVTVELVDEDSGHEVSYKLVGEDEADIKINKISVGSPIAKALIGKEEGDVIEVRTPGGTRTFELVEVKYI